MTDTLLGNIMGTAYFVYFQLAGILLALFAMPKEKTATKLVVGSGLGSLCLQWICVLWAFAFGFDIIAHIAAVATMLPVFVVVVYFKVDIKQQIKNLFAEIKRHKAIVVLFGAMFVLWCVLLDGHIIPMSADGAIRTGQCTYGDMNMHLGFISSIAQLGEFPPVYSIFPDTKLAYPFLNASISSSIYLLGASLRWAYILPMIGAFLQVCGMVYIIAITVFKSRLKAIIAWVMVLLNGGLGFIYFMGAEGSTLKFKDIFTGFYTTPTNLVDYNIRWVNIIADILLPQRASLFGYAILLCAVWLLYKAQWHVEKRYFIFAAVFAGALPLIHTHSFLAMGLISAAWLLMKLYCGVVDKTANKWTGAVVLTVFVAVMCILQQLNNRGLLSSEFFFAFGVTGIGICVLVGVWLMIRYINKHGFKELLTGWGVYLAIVLLFALPQLIGWTFGQVEQGGFLRGHFNWGNLGDFYPWFYIKNIGAPLVAIVGAVCVGGRKTARLVLPAGVIWFVAELILFTPNTYDNNKLLYVAYVLLCIAAADFAVEWYNKRRNWSAKIIAVVFAVLCTASAVLTLGRETVSDYVLYSADHVALAQYVEENVESDAVILTNTRHNNEIASLTGRKIVCGSDVFLYYHGIDTTQRKWNVQQMYQQVAESADLYEKYSVDYVLVSSWEKADYYIDEPLFNQMFDLVFQQNSVTLYKVK